MKQSTTIRADGVDIKRWETAANLSGLSYSEWARRALNEAAAGRRKIEPEEYLGAKNSDSGVVETADTRPRKESRKRGSSQGRAHRVAAQAPAVRTDANAGSSPDPATNFPEASPVRRKYVNVREDLEEAKPPKKFRCTYLWPSNSKKCPRCHEVHTDV